MKSPSGMSLTQMSEVIAAAGRGEQIQRRRCEGECYADCDPNWDFSGW